MAGSLACRRRDVGPGFVVDLLEVVPHHRREHALAAVVGVHAHPAQAGARHLAEARRRARVRPGSSGRRRRRRGRSTGRRRRSRRRTGAPRGGPRALLGRWRGETSWNHTVGRSRGSGRRPVRGPTRIGGTRHPPANRAVAGRLNRVNRPGRRTATRRAAYPAGGCSLQSEVARPVRWGAPDFGLARLKPRPASASRRTRSAPCRAGRPAS